jgi:transcriptional regulator with XRE-family HTH domain
MRLGDRIKQAREKLGMSQQRLADNLGSISRNAISYWEAGKTNPATGHLLKLPEILQVDPIWLFAGDSADALSVPILSWVSAGRLADSEAVEAWHDVEKVDAVGLPKGAWIALRVEGTSMDRIAPPDSLIFVNRRERELLPGRDYVFRAGDGASFKRFRSSPDRFEPYSSDPEHQTIFPEGQVRVIGRVRRVQIDV